VTAYSILKDHPALELAWYRLILDESQELKKLDSAASSLVASIRSPRRWALSGTPMPHSFHDLNGQLRALGVVPYDKYSTFNARLNPNKNGIWRGFHRIEADGSVQPLLHVLSSMAIRHSKRSQLGEIHVQLPPLSMEERLVTPRAAELAAYEQLLSKVTERIQHYFRTTQFGDHLPKINSHLLQLRLACAHPSLAHKSAGYFAHSPEDADLVKRFKSVTTEELLRQARADGPAVAEYVKHLIAPLFKGSGDGSAGGGTGGGAAADGAGGGLDLLACSICMDEMSLPVLTPCSHPHMFCLRCLQTYITSSDRSRTGEGCKCPTCRTVITSKSLRVLILPPPPATSDLAAEVAPLAGSEGGESAKLEALVAELKTDLTAHPKSVVFTHFPAAQRLICERLAQEKVAFAQIAMGSTQRQRMNALQTFTSDPTISVFVLSMKAAAVGLTLTCATRLILYEPGLNLAAEQQAIGRVHRFGQQRPVRIVKLALAHTLEQPILELNRTAPRPTTASGSGAANLSLTVGSSSEAADPGGGSSEAAPLQRDEQKTLNADQVLQLLGMDLCELRQLQYTTRAQHFQRLPR